jgi:topoisomerase-4 subunit B
MYASWYIGKLGDGSLLMMEFTFLKEVLDNCIDEFVMGAGKTIEVTIRTKR